MNKAYRLIWSKAKDAWVIVAEIVKGNGGPPPITVTAVVVAAALALAAGRADALPTGQQVVNGTATFVTSGSTLTVTNSPNSIINWQGFSIGAGERTTFNQQSTSSAVLNRVIGPTSSSIFGMLDSNGKVFLINPNGILFGAGSQVNVGGLVASSLGISNNDFINGTYRFSGGAASGPVSNAGTITTTGGGKVWLIAPNVTNTGIITAPNGDIVLAAGQQVYMVDQDHPETAVLVSAPADTALNMGTITAQAGKVGIFGALVNQGGVVSADGAVAGPGGSIYLKSSGTTTLASGSSTTANGSGGGYIETVGPTVGFTGATVSATGGTWRIAQDNMDITAPVATSFSNALNTGTSVQAEVSATAPLATDLSVNAAITKSAGADASLTLKANRSVFVNAPITSTSGKLDVTLDAHQGGGLYEGYVSIQNTSITTNGGNLVVGGGVDPYTNTANAIYDLTTPQHGVYINNSFLRAGGGNITVNGAADYSGFTGSQGVYITGGSELSTTGSGNINIKGGAAGNTDVGSGVILTGASVSTGSGSIRIEGNNTAGGNGISVNSATVASTSGDITLTGVTSAPLTNYGVDLSTVTLTTGSGGTLSLMANSLNLSGATLGGTNVAFGRSTSGTIELGSAATTTAGNLALTPAFLDTISTPGGALRIGDARNTTGILISSAMNRNNQGNTVLNQDTLHLITNGGFGGIGQTAPLTVTNLALDTNNGNSINLLSGANDIGTLAVNGWGRISLMTGKTLTVGAVDGLTGITGTGFVALTADNLNINQPISAPYVYLYPASGARDINLVSSSVAKPGFALELTNEELNRITATNVLELQTPTGNINVSAPIVLDSAKVPNFTLSSKTMTIGDTLSNAGGTIALNTTGATSDINLVDTKSGATLDLTIDDLNRITAANLVIENYTTGGITVSATNAPIFLDSTKVQKLTLIADNMSISSTNGLSNTGGTITLQPTTTSRDIVLMAGSTKPGTALEFTTDDLNRIFATSLELQNSVGGAITVSAPIALTSTKVPTLNLIADSMTISSTLKILDGSSNPAGTIALRPYTQGTNIDLVVTKPPSGTLGLTSTEINNITAGTLKIGDSATTGNITVSDTMNFTGIADKVRLTASGDITQSTTGLGIAFTNLALDAGGNIALTDPSNNISTVAAKAVGDISIKASALTVGTVDGMSDIQTTGNVTLAANTMTLAGSLVSGSNVTLTRNSAGDITLVGTGGTPGATLNLTNSDLGAVRVNNNLTIENRNTGGLLTVSGAITSLTSEYTPTVTLSSDKLNISTTSGGSLNNTGGTIALKPFTPSTPILLDSTGVTFDGGNNHAQWSKLSANSLVVGATTNTGGISVNDESSLPTTVNANLALVTGGAITFSTPISVGSNNLTLNTGAGSTTTQPVSGTGTITAGGLELIGGSFTLPLVNMVDTLAAFDSQGGHSLTFTNGKTLTIGTVGNTTGIDDVVHYFDHVALTTTAGNLVINAPIRVNTTTSLTSSGDMAINAPLSTTYLTLKSDGSVTQSQSQSADINVSGGLELLGTGSYTLTDPNNFFYQLAGNTGSVTVKNYQNTLTIGTVNSSVGLTTTGNVDLTATGPLSSDGIVINKQLSAANITLNGTGGVADNCSDGCSGGNGVSINNSGSITATSGSVNVTGLGGNGGSYGLSGGHGIFVNGIITASANGGISLVGTGGTGGRYSGEGQNGGDGIQINSSGGLTSGSGAINLTGIGGAGGSYQAGTGYYPGNNGYNGIGGAGGAGITVSSASITSGSGSLTMNGTGGAGGNGLGGDGAWGGSYSSVGTGTSGGNGGNGTGGAGGNGIATLSNSGPSTISGFSSISMTGIGGAGGAGIGGFGGAGDSGTSSNGGAGGAGGIALGGAGGSGISLSGSDIYSSSIITLNGTGGASGNGFGGFGGSGGLGGSGYNGGAAGVGGAGFGGYTGMRGLDLGGTITVSASGTINLTGIGSNGGDGFGGNAGVGGSAGAGTGGVNGASGVSGSGTGASGGNGIYARSVVTADGGTINMIVSGGLGGVASANPGSDALGITGETPTFNAGTTGTVTITTPSVSQISLGTGTAGGVGIDSFQILSNITAGSVVIGDSVNTSAIVLDGAVNMKDATPLSLVTSGTVTDVAGTPFGITAPILTVNAGTGISLLGANLVPIANLNTISGNIAFNNTLTVAQASHLNTTGTTSLTSTGVLTVDGTSGTLTTNSVGLSFGATTISGDLNAISTGGVSQTGKLAVSGATTILAGTNTINLNDATNALAGPVNVTGGTTTIKDASALTAHLTTGTTDLTSGGILSIDGTTGNLTTNSAGLSFGPTTVTGNLGATSTGAVAQTGVLTVTGTTSIAAGSNSVALNNPGNDFAGVLTVAGGTTSIKDANTLVAHLNTGATDLTTVGALTVDGTSGSLTTNSAGLTLGSGTMTASGALSATSTGNIIYQNTVSAADLSLNASGSITGTTGVLTASGKLSLIAGSGINLFGNATGQGGVALSSGTGLLDTSKGIVSNGGTSAPVNLIGDSFNLGTFSAGSAPLQITTFTKSQALNLGSGSSTLPLSASSLVFGDAGHTGAININGPLNLGGTASFLSSGGSLSLLGAITAPGAITIDTLGGGATTGSVTGTGSIKATSLNVNAGSGIDLGGSNAVTTLNLKNAGPTGNVNFKNSAGAGTNLTLGGSNSAAGGSFTVAEATGGMAIAGITTSNGAVSLSGAQDISFSTAINAGTGAVSLTTTGGAISGLPGASSIVAGSAQLAAINGIGATTPFQTTVGKLGASNTNNAIQLKNSGVLTVTGITNGGLILLDNTGATTLAGAVKSKGSTVRVTAHSPLTTTAGADVSAYGDVTLFAGASGSIYDSLTINSLVDSQTGNVLLMAGESVFVNGVTVKASENLTGNSFLNALNGKVIIRDHLNSHLTVLTTQTAALLPGVYEALNENIAVMGREATDLTKEENSTGEGGQNGTEFKSLPYCN